MYTNQDLLEAVKRLIRNYQRRPAGLRTSTCGRSQGKVLKLIAGHEGITINELAVILDVRAPTLTEKLNKLEVDGNIKRVRDKKDARFVRLYTTKLGRDAVRKRDVENKSIARDFSDCLTEEEKELFITMCNKLNRRIEEIREEELKEYHNVIRMQLNSEDEEIDQIV